MTDRAEEVLAAIKTAVTNLTTTSLRVVRGRTYPADLDDGAALSVNMGGETPVEASNMQFQDELLTVEITAHVRAKESAGVDTALNQIRAEVYAAVMASRQLGKGWVHDTRWAGRSAPQRDDGAQQPTVSQTFNFVVHYRHGYTTTEG